MSKWISVLAAMVVGMTTAYAASPVAASQPDGGQAGALRGLEVGTRIIHVMLQEDEKGTGTDTRDDNFLGSIDMLDEDQDYAPTRLYLQYFFSENFGVGISYDSVEADAKDESASDGVISVDGPILYLVGRYPNASDFTLFAELGVAFYQSSFDPVEGWADDGDFRRFMETDDTEALVLGFGCDYAITESLSVNLYARVVEGASFDAAHYNTEDASKPRQSGSFNLDYFGTGVGIKYAFQ
jgi:outer membrane protein W